MISIATARGIAMMVAVALIFGLGFAAGHRWLALDFATYREDQAKALVAAQDEAAKAARKRGVLARQIEAQHTKQVQDREVETRVITRDVIRYVARPESECVADAEWVRLYNASNGMPGASEAAGKPAGGAE